MRAPWPGRRLGLRTGNVYLGTPDRWETITETTVHEGLNGKEASTTRRRVFVPGRDGADHPDSMTFRQPADLDVFLRFLPVVGTVMSIAEGDLEGAILGLAGDFLWGLGALAKAGRAANLARGAHAAENVADGANLFRNTTRFPLPLVDDAGRIGQGARAASNPLDSLYRMLFGQACFVAGTPLLTPDGAKPIEAFRVGDRILSRPEGDCEALVAVQVVEETFVRTAPIWALTVGGRTIRTTAEHPFFVQGKGWTNARALQVGDLLSSHDGQWIPVETITDLNEVATVYNLRVSGFSTYFVGGADWGFSLWAHNSCTEIVSESGVTTLRIKNKFLAGSAESRQLQRFVRAWNEEIANAGGSMTRRTLTQAEARQSRAWTEAMRELFPSRFEGRVVGHIPDAAAGGAAVPGRAMALLPDVNSYLGGLLNGVPVGTTYNRVVLFR